MNKETEKLIKQFTGKVYTSAGIYTAAFRKHLDQQAKYKAVMKEKINGKT